MSQKKALFLGRVNPPKYKNTIALKCPYQLPSNAGSVPELWNLKKKTLPQESQNWNTWLLFSVLRADRLTTVCRVLEQDVRSVALPVLAIVIRRMG